MHTLALYLNEVCQDQNVGFIPQMYSGREVILHTQLRIKDVYVLLQGGKIQGTLIESGDIDII